MGCSGWDCGVKKSLHAQEQDTEEGQRRRQAWREQVSQIDRERLVFLDESGVTTQLNASLRPGATERAGAGRRSRRTLADADSAGSPHRRRPAGPHDHRVPHDGDVFLAYLEQVLCPQLQPGHVVIMDNLAAHKVAGVRSLIEACGAQLLYLPPYSPDFNPIEQAWSKIKEILRAAKARLLDAFEAAIAQALAAVTADNAAAWFRHCGYGVHQL